MNFELSSALKTSEILRFRESGAGLGVDGCSTVEDITLGDDEDYEKGPLQVGEF